MLTDNYGLIVTRNWKGELDGGDTLTNEFTYRIGLELLEKSDNNILNLNNLLNYLIINNKGDFIRHPDFAPYGDWSPGRDQMIAPIVFATFLNLKDIVAREELKSMINTGFKIRNGKYQSKDIPFIELWSLLTRMNREIGIKSYLKCLIGDLWILGDVFNRIGWLPKYRHDKDKKWVWQDHEDVDDRNCILTLIQSKLHNTTFISRLAWKLYFKKRDWMGALRTYFRLESGNNPEIAETLIEGINAIR